MSSFAKFFTVPLSQVDRRSFYEALSLDKLSYYYFEVCGKLVLNGEHVDGLVSVPLLEPLSSDGLNELKETLPSPCFTLTHDGPGLSVNPVPMTSSLWEALFPYPFRCLSGLFHPVLGLKVDVFPQSLNTPLRALFESLAALEARLAESEVSLLHVIGDRASLPLLFHYLGPRRVRVGTGPSLQTLTQEVSRDPAQIHAHFGPSASFFALDLRGAGEHDPLMRVSRRIRESLSEVRSDISVDRPAPSAPPEMRL